MADGVVGGSILFESLRVAAVHNHKRASGVVVQGSQDADVGFHDSRLSLRADCF